MGRVTATVLFTDLVGSTELRGRLGEEAAEELRRRHDQLLTEAVEAHSGRVVKGLGDGIMATFAGASDAVAAAVAIQQGIDRLDRSGKTPMPLEVRVGLSAGDVTVEDDDVHGTPVIEAARLCGAAGGGEILAADVVRVLAGLSEDGLADRGRIELKGLQKPVWAWEVGWEAAAISIIPMPAMLTDVGRIFVGRDGELERLQQLWKEATAGERRVALLAGEPGVGKTRLAAELATGVHKDGAVVLAGRCDEDLGVPFQPFVEALRHYGAHVAEPRLGHYGGELTRLVPKLAAKVAGLAEPLRSDPETERYRLFDAVAAWLAEVSVEDPVLLVLDDVHWAAKPTLLLLRHVLRSAETRRLLVLATYRDSEVGRGHPLAELLADLRRVEGVERFPLAGLDRAGVAAFIGAAAGHALSEDDAGLPQAVWTETGGNPFFVVEVLRHLAETGGVEQRGGRWVVTAPVDELGIPEGVRDVVGRRLSRLSETANRALWVGSVVGLEFDSAVIRMAGDLTDEALFSSLEEAAGAGLVSESGSRYRFSHALVRATLYDEMTVARRVALHRRVAEAIETVHAGALDDHLPALAHHWARAGAPAAATARAVDYATRAGDRALAQLAHDEAAAYYRQANDLLGGVTGTDTEWVEARRLELLILLGEAQRRAGDADYRETLIAAGRLARRRADGHALSRAALANHRGLWSSAWTVDAERVEMLEAALAAGDPADSPDRARLLANLGAELHYSADWKRRRALSDDALAMARRLNEPATLAHVLLAWCASNWDPATSRNRLAFTDELLDLAECLNDQLTRFLTWMWRVITAMDLGQMEEADRALENLRMLSDELGQPALRWLSVVCRPARVLLAGRIDEAEKLAVEARELGRETGQPDARLLFGMQRLAIRFEQGRVGEVIDRLAEVAKAEGRPSSQAFLALAYCETDREGEARRVFEPLAARLADLPLDNEWIYVLTTSAAVCAHLGDRAVAARLRDILAPCAAHITGTGTFRAGSVSHYLGRLATTLGRFDEAEDRFRAAADTHQRISALAWLARTQMEWARMLLAPDGPGDAERARELLGQALDTARELGLGGVEREAVRLLGALP